MQKMSVGVNVIDGSTQQWHSDGNEVMDSRGRSPLIGNVVAAILISRCRQCQKDENQEGASGCETSNAG
jgi:hypothetical protein